MREYVEREAAINAIEYRITKLMKDPEFRKKRVDIDLYGVKQNILNIPAADVEEVRHGKWVVSYKHLWKKESNGDIDYFAGMDIGYHNGPLCVKCGLSFCEHCEPGMWESKCDVPHFVCQLCGEETAQIKNYCPNCGTKMDGGADDGKADK